MNSIKKAIATNAGTLRIVGAVFFAVGAGFIMGGEKGDTFYLHWPLCCLLVGGLMIGHFTPERYAGSGYEYESSDDDTVTVDGVRRE